MMVLLRDNNRSPLGAVVLAAIVACVLVAVAAAAAAPDGEQARQDERSKLLDFEHFKRTFRKSYANAVEELARKTNFLARALKAYVSAVAYRYRQSSFYLAVNFMSDMTREEGDRMRNKALEESDGAQTIAELAQPLEPGENQKPMDVRELNQLVDSQIDRALSDPEFAAALGGDAEGGRRRAKRSAGGRGARRPREISMAMLIKDVEFREESPAALAKLDPRPESNNPDYEPVEMMSMGLRDNQQDLTYWTIRATPKEPPKEVKSNVQAIQELAGSLLTNGFGWAKNLALQFGRRDADDEQFEDAEGELEDEVFFDQSDSGCMFLPRNQGKCGSCYAFAAVTLMEWLHCTMTDKLVAFSEQYMVDCGGMAKDKLVMRGCDGARLPAIPHFIHNFGAELRAHYPYQAQDGVCPYPEQTNLKSAGFIRMKLTDVLSVPVNRWPKLIEFAPMYLQVATDVDFNSYGGGVFDGLTCGPHLDHAMVLVGHGREDGREYWLIRNSYGVGWGDGGHWKLAKDAPERCIDRQLGYILGAKRGTQFTAVVEQNPHNWGKFVRDRKINDLLEHPLPRLL